MARSDKEQNALHQFSSVFFFIFFAALLWLIIKLSATYTVTEPITITLVNNPADMIITDGTQNQKTNVTLSASGFDLLNYYFRPAAKRKVDVSLENMPIHADRDDIYSFNSRYAIEKIANFLKMDIHEISLNDDRIYFRMQNLDSKKVKVLTNIDISYEKQFNRHGKIQVKPDSVLIFGPEDVLSSIDNIYTDKVKLKDVNSNIDMNVPLHFDKMLNSDTKDVNIKIEVERYTEAIANVPIINNSARQLRFFPDKVKVKYIVSLTDYNIINENSFKIAIDTVDIDFEDNFLPVYLIDYPYNTIISSIEPKQVEYIIIEENGN